MIHVFMPDDKAASAYVKEKLTPNNSSATKLTKTLPQTLYSRLNLTKHYQTNNSSATKLIKTLPQTFHSLQNKSRNNLKQKKNIFETKFKQILTTV